MDHTVADPLPEVIALRRLIKDHRDDTVAGGAELLVNRNVGEATGRERADGRRLVARAGDLVQRSCVLREEGTNGTAKGVSTRARGHAGTRAGRRGSAVCHGDGRGVLLLRLTASTRRRGGGHADRAAEWRHLSVCRRRGRAGVVLLLGAGPPRLHTKA